MTVSPKLMDAYREADYVVFAEPEFVLKIGEPSSRLDALLEEEGATTAAFLTAANPRSKPQSAAQNTRCTFTLPSFSSVMSAICAM